jgi:hypothetical protein
MGGSSGIGVAGGGSSVTCERSNTAPRRKYVRGRAAGSVPAASHSATCLRLGEIGTQMRMTARSPLRTQ